MKSRGVRDNVVAHVMRLDEWTVRYHKKATIMIEPEPITEQECLKIAHDVIIERRLCAEAFFQYNVRVKPIAYGRKIAMRRMRDAGADLSVIAAVMNLTRQTVLAHLNKMPTPMEHKSV
jgi:hypothetical protein